jgi:hypothetical protein
MRHPLAALFLSAAALGAADAARAAEPADVIREIEQQWDGRVVRDSADPDCPVVEIVFHCTSKVPDSVAAKLSAFPKTRRLGLVGGKNIADAGLKHIADLRELTTLEVHSRGVTAAGLKCLAALPKLQKVFLWKDAMTREEFEALEAFPALEALELENVQAPPEALASLARMPRLKVLDAFRCGGVLDPSVAEQARKALPKVEVSIHD